MSSPVFGFSSWRGRTPSVNSRDNSQDEHSGNPFSPPRPTISANADARLSSSYASSSHREPLRSFIHGTVRDHLSPLDAAQHARSVREDTAELATYLLSDKKSGQSPAFLSRPRSYSVRIGRDSSTEDHEEGDDVSQFTDGQSDAIIELPEPESPENLDEEEPQDPGPSILASMLRGSPATKAYRPGDDEQDEAFTETSGYGGILAGQTRDRASRVTNPTESTSLLHPGVPEPQHLNGLGRGSRKSLDLESQKAWRSSRWLRGISDPAGPTRARLATAWRTVRDPKCWDRRAIWETVVVAPVACLPAVVVGLLLNVLDALSYGMILFPLGNPIFANLGSAGISIFYVSTIVSQIIFSFGSTFKGVVGSQLIEVVPFFHSMAGTIIDIVGEDDPTAVIATTITSYALSSVLTGAVFYLMGQFKFGYIVGFIPRHILIGCIGGVGWFLVATGFEVTARMDGSLEYDLNTLKRLTQPDTIPLWIIPLGLAFVLFFLQKRITSRYFLSCYILAIPCVFYFFVLSLDALEPDSLRDSGWIFNGPPAGESWWFFYTLYRFDKVHWGAIVQCVPAMFALTFFGILHVPINVPALAQSIGEDHADLDHELKLHGYTNLIAGLVGSIQNYLVYANSLFFMRSGGNSRLAGFELAALTAVLMVIGPSLIGFIPIMMVGVLIFDLGFELLMEAIWAPRKKLKLLEYLTVIAIVLIMGIYDFVIGIAVGILLAFISLIFQASRVSAIRVTYFGDEVGSTVRRNPSQQHYLEQVGHQIYVMKLAGFLFFGTIVSVDTKIRELIADDAFKEQPIKFMVLDLSKVTGLDYSAAEVFAVISRLLKGKNIVLVISGVEAESPLGRDLLAAGLAEEGEESLLLPDLNSALEFSENELLKTFYASEQAIRTPQPEGTASLEVPGASSKAVPSDLLASSPRQNHLQQAATKLLNQTQVKRLSRWQTFKEPLRLMLQIFQDLSDKNEDFWFRAVGYFARKEYIAGTVLFRCGEPAQGFYLLESGIIRAEYDLPHGYMNESIVAGTTCGELPFFSETSRTATAVVERDCIVWLMDKPNWEKLQREQPDIAQELLRISLKLTSERMSATLSYGLALAG